MDWSSVDVFYSEHPNEEKRLNGEMALWESRPLQTPNYRNSPIEIRHGVPRGLEASCLSSKLVFCLDSKVKGTLIPLRIIGSFFDYIPARLGHNLALDDAVSCVCNIYCGGPSSPANIQNLIYQSYVRAISSLRGCLGDTSVRMEPETLCASILLQMCEV